MIWQRLSREWRSCVEEAWSAYCHGSLPHGAVVIDAQGNMVAHGRNRIREQTTVGKQLAGHRLAHAEINALLQIDWRITDVYSCKLYSIIEPCPMCIGAVRMAHMQEVHYAVRDGGAGGASLVDKTPFLKSGNIQVIGPEDPDLETILMAMQVEATLSQSHPHPQEWIEQLARAVPEGARLGNELFATHLLRQWKDEGKETAFALDQLHQLLLQLS